MFMNPITIMLSLTGYVLGLQITVLLDTYSISFADYVTVPILLSTLGGSDT